MRPWIKAVLTAARLLVLPGEETVFWQNQHIHQRKRQVAASKALIRLARWLAAGPYTSPLSAQPEPF